MARQPKLFTNPKEPVTRDSLIQWLYETGWFEGHLRKRMSPLDYPHAEDYIQSCWEELCKIPESKLLEIWNKGKGRFVNYIKALIGNQIYSGSSKTFKENKSYYFDEVYMDDNDWTSFIEGGEADYDQQFPQIRREGKLSNRVVFEYDRQHIKSEINLYEDDRDFEEE